MNQYKDLLKEAILFIKSGNIPDTAWSFGGGTALMFYYNHRYSKDIDIFLHDAQYLTYLTPRLNDYVENKVDDYEEMSNSLKLKMGEHEIDFIIAPSLTKIPFNIINIDDQDIRIETPEEIVIKKIFYRCEAFKVRDIVDLAVVIKNNKQSLLSNIEVYKRKLGQLMSRIKRLKDIYPNEVKELEILDVSLVNSAFNIVLNFVEECIKNTTLSEL